MKLVILMSFLALMSFKSLEGDETFVRTNYLVGTNIYEKTDKKSMDDLLTLCLKDKNFASKFEEIKKNNKMGIEICYGIWDDKEIWCLKGSNSKKGSLCSVDNFSIKKIPYFQRYCFLYECQSGEILMVWLC